MTNRSLKSTLSAMALLSALPVAAHAQATEVTAALYGEPDALNPIFETNLPALNVYYNVFDRLATIDGNGDVVPNLASGWSANETADVWTFTLNEGMTCQDGNPMDSADVKFTFDTATGDSASRLGGYLGLVDSVEATTPTEVVINLKQAFAPFDRQVSLIPIVCQEAYEEMGQDAFARSPVGSGPYQVTDWIAGDAIVLESYDGYWGEPAKYEKVTFKPIPDETTRASAVQSGDVDVALLGPAQVEAVEAQGSVNIQEQDANRVVYVGFNGTVPFLSEPSMRKAVDLAIDRTLISERLLNGAATPTAQLIAPVTFGFDPSLPATEQDVDRAKALLEEVGYDGTPIKISYPTTGLPQVDQLAQAVGFFLNEVGIQTELDPQEQNTFYGNWFGNKFEGLFIFAFAPSVMDAHLPFYMLLAKDQEGYIYDDRIDELMAKQVGEGDPEARAADLAEISKINYERTIYAPLFIDSYIYGVSKDIEWSSRPDGMMVFR
ncbi:ABC transporter substrate-binding protein [Pseudooceanicola sp. MF1-13]|uniref:ABC transporter substrate-binding protein n=1 Tax=Pseudooceanicola sp. MF1-13 TaxID=3379095 RepID=UPI0038923D2E